MAGMQRCPETDDCIRKDKRKAGQSRNKRAVPRVIMKSIRFTVAHEDKVDRLMSKYGYRCQADFYEDSVAALACMLKEGPVPPFARIELK